MTTRQKILAFLTNKQLRQLIKTLQPESLSTAKKRRLLDCLLNKHRVTKAQIVSQLTVREMRDLCEKLNLTFERSTRAGLIAAITGDDRGVLRDQILKSLKSQGFQVSIPHRASQTALEKPALRSLHVPAVEHKRERSAETLSKKENDLLKWIANGDEIRPESIRPRLVEVERGSFNELLFRYACLHWSIPVSSGYGRRLRYLVIDENNDRLMGLIGLGDPVFALAARDQWIGWDSANRSKHLTHVVDAFVLGAVPPYSHLLCGKLIALLAASDEVRSRFRQKYCGTTSLISEQTQTGDIALITTTSALGRSSVYNRLSHQGRCIYQSVGYTRGYGDFQFMNGLYDTLRERADLRHKPSAKKEKWGTGYRNRREVVKKCLNEVGLSPELLCHGIYREIFVVPLASNSREFLCGQDSALHHHAQPAAELFDGFRQRWLIRRAMTDQRYRLFHRDIYRIWGS